MQLTMPETGRVSTRMEWNAGETRLRGETYVLVPCEATGQQRVCDALFQGPCETAWVSLPCLSFAAAGIEIYELTSGSYVKIDDGVSPASYVRI